MQSSPTVRLLLHAVAAFHRYRLHDQTGAACLRSGTAYRKQEETLLASLGRQYCWWAGCAETDRRTEISFDSFPPIHHRPSQTDSWRIEVGKSFRPRGARCL